MNKWYALNRSYVSEVSMARPSVAGLSKVWLTWRSVAFSI